MLKENDFLFFFLRNTNRYSIQIKVKIISNINQFSTSPSFRNERNYVQVEVQQYKNSTYKKHIAYQESSNIQNKQQQKGTYPVRKLTLDDSIYESQSDLLKEEKIQVLSNKYMQLYWRIEQIISLFKGKLQMERQLMKDSINYYMAELILIFDEQLDSAMKHCLTQFNNSQQIVQINQKIQAIEETMNLKQFNEISRNKNSDQKGQYAENKWIQQKSDKIQQVQNENLQSDQRQVLVYIVFLNKMSENYQKVLQRIQGFRRMEELKQKYIIKNESEIKLIQQQQDQFNAKMQMLEETLNKKINEQNRKLQQFFDQQNKNNPQIATVQSAQNNQMKGNAPMKEYVQQFTKRLDDIEGKLRKLKSIDDKKQVQEEGTKALETKNQQYILFAEILHQNKLLMKINHELWTFQSNDEKKRYFKR